MGTFLPVHPLQNPVSICTWECISILHQYCTMVTQCFNAYKSEREDPYITHPSSALTTRYTTSFYLEFNACPYLCPIQQTNWFSIERLSQRTLCIIIDYFPHHHFTKVLTCNGLASWWRKGERWLLCSSERQKNYILYKENDFIRKKI